MERVSKVISNNGYCSRRKAEELITLKKVKINGVIANLGDKVKASDKITINDIELKKDLDNKEYYLLNKPRGVISTSSDEVGRKTVTDIIETNKRIYPIGRLDYDTTGALLLTNDGDLTTKLTHPSSKVDKVYLAKVKGIMTGSDVNVLKNGVKTDNYKTSPCRVKLKHYDKETKTSMVELTIHEGHNHQVKKMLETIGYDVIRLTRIRFAFLDVKDLKSGEYRPLTPKEVKKLYSLVENS